MKLKKEPLDIDLYVVHANPTGKDLKEMAEFVENHKKQQALKAKHTLALKKKKAKKYKTIEPSIPFFREPEPDLYANLKPMTLKDKKKRKVVAKRKVARKKGKA